MGSDSMMIRNPVFNGFGGIDCEINHTYFGWIPFTASPNDIEEFGRKIYSEALKLSPLEYVQPVDYVSVPQVVSRFQARAALLDAGLLADVEIALQSADTITQLAWAEAVEWRRDSPTISAIATALGLSEEDIDNLFIAAAEIKA